MRSATPDLGRPKGISGGVTSAGVPMSPGFTVTKTGTGTYTVRVSGARAILMCVVTASASPPWTANGGSGPQTGDSFAVNTFNSTTAAAQDIGFTFYAEYR